VTVNWSDPTGCDGAQADLRTFGAFGVHGACVVAAVRTGKTPASLHALPEAAVTAQIESVAALGAVPAKVSVPHGSAQAAAAIALLQRHGFKQIVFDAASTLDGAHHGPIAGLDALKKHAAPAATVLYVDVAAASTLAGVPIKNQTAARAAAKLLHRLGPRLVLVNCSDLPGDEWMDILFDGKQTFDFPGERVSHAGLPGMASTYTAAITSGLAHGRSVEEAVAVAKIYVIETLRNAYSTGADTLSPGHLYAWWDSGGRNGYGG
jgi:hydroxymethylpyrimidine kinase/phosphomethylpyrimidine kinase